MKAVGICIAMVLAALSAAPGYGMAPVQGNPSGQRALAAARLIENESVALDGQLDEPAWMRAVPAADFIQRDPANGAPATESTEVRVVYERDRLYVGVICRDSEPGGILGNQMQR